MFFLLLSKNKKMNAKTILVVLEMLVAGSAWGDDRPGFAEQIKAPKVFICFSNK